jgi:Uma2 family endonuclease
MSTKTEGSAAIDTSGHYTYKEYKNWPEGERWELIEGSAYAMSPAPTYSHQRLVVDLVGKLYAFLQGKHCELLAAPIDVFLPSSRGEAEDDIDTIVQPDVIVVCDHDKLCDKGVRGGPDFVVEILSPSTAMKDLSKKKKLYAKHGVREYWILNPEDLSILAYRRDGEGFGRALEYRHGESVDSSALPGFVWQSNLW